VPWWAANGYAEWLADQTVGKKVCEPYISDTIGFRLVLQAAK
jgi:hypothetical protein